MKMYCVITGILSTASSSIGRLSRVMDRSWKEFKVEWRTDEIESQRDVDRISHHRYSSKQHQLGSFILVP